MIFIDLEYTDPDVYSPNCFISEIAVAIVNGNLWDAIPIAHCPITYLSKKAYDNLSEDDDSDYDMEDAE